MQSVLFHDCTCGVSPMLYPYGLCLYLFFSFHVTKSLKGTCLSCSLDFGMQLVFHFGSFLLQFFAPQLDKTCKSTAARPLILNLYKNKINSPRSLQYLWKFFDKQDIYTWPEEERWGREWRDEDKRRSESRRKVLGNLHKAKKGLRSSVWT